MIDRTWLWLLVLAVACSAGCPREERPPCDDDTGSAGDDDTTGSAGDDDTTGSTGDDDTSSAGDDDAAPVPSIALYESESACADCLVALEAMLASFGYESTRLDAWQIEHGELGGHDAFVVPGGWAPGFNEELVGAGFGAIRTFVSGGGGYLGTCAGAYFAADAVEWEGGSYGAPLGLLEVTAVGPLEAIAPWPEYAVTGITYEDHPLAANLPQADAILYWGGPSFSGIGEDVEILARYEEGGEPSMILGSYGLGRVALVGPHPEIEEGSTADGVEGWDDELVDPVSDWPLMHNLLEWMLQGTP